MITISLYKTTLKKKQHDMELAAKEFAAGSSIQEVMLKYNICYASVYNAIKRYKVDYNHTFGRQIFFNQNYFENVLEEQQAYWLGFIYADGSVVKSDSKTSGYNRMQIGLSIKDVDHLKLFANCIDYPVDNLVYYTPPNSYARTQMCYIQCNSPKMANDLIKAGCVPNKTTHSFLPQIPDILMKHFIRGYFDGDGSIGNNFSITSEGNILHSIQTVLMDECNLNRTKMDFRKNSYTMTYGGINQLRRIFHYLYDDANIYLQRKYDKFHSVVLTTDETILLGVAC